jgi:hypothetical protein
MVRKTAVRSENEGEETLASRGKKGKGRSVVIVLCAREEGARAFEVPPLGDR